MAGKRVAERTEPSETTTSNMSPSLKQQVSDRFLQRVSASINGPLSEASFLKAIDFLDKDSERAFKRDIIITSEILLAIVLIVVFTGLIYPGALPWTLPGSTGVLGALSLVRRFLEKKKL